ncbi:DNA polymerase epsilon subunit 3 [Mycena venus]|uniref:DNA polymerase epsilon subunit D n=1 Tax=Mycena venus TaxID=2733690 RepID=A0A8H6XCD3_9AGAR|nr:DNA polymerase epsilon subunit 3 [Mycena venus]
MPRKETPQGGAISAQAQQDLISEGMENFELPKSLVTRIARSALPENVKMQKETVVSLIKGSTVFINYLASDVLKALEMIEFGDLVDKLQAELVGTSLPIEITLMLTAVLVVYREQAKTDKSKKGSSNVNSTVVKGKTTSVASTPKSAKGKEKATIVLPPLASASVSIVDPTESISSGPGLAMDVDEQADVDVRIETDGEGEGERQEEEEEEPEEPEDIEDDEEPEELVDTVALDMQDMQRDARGLEEPRVEMED